ncbi:hypothetical protein [Alkalihalobacterium elongatum]|uniref:hypothetical protein n=1 Tax=Alkalihalobacterium elongatum TaxID=2675466 RepID=UPI001C1F2EF9|nr:hypothetical protein [Alkalihalobacterium elongatum]
MSQHKHVLSITDFQDTQHNTTFVIFSVYDDILGKYFEGEVKFLGGRPYGDIIHEERSSLSTECRQFVQETLLEKYNNMEFH